MEQQDATAAEILQAARQALGFEQGNVWRQQAALLGFHKRTQCN